MVQYSSLKKKADHHFKEKHIMKNISFVRNAAVVLLAAGVLFGCGKASGNVPQTEPQSEPQAEVESEASTEAEAEPQTGMGNPWRECTEEEAKKACPRLFKAPEDAMVNGWSMMEAGSGESGIPGPLVQLDFRMRGVDFTARARYGVDEKEDITGMYGEWTDKRDVTLANWGGGNMPAKISRSIEDDWMIDLCTWYDTEIGIAYCLSAESDDLEGFDIQAVAEQMYDPANEPDAGPDSAGQEETSEEKSFAEDNSFIDEYEQFTVTSENLHDGVWDDVISYTDAGENKSPQLSWKPVDGAKLYLIYMSDLGAWNLIHWKTADVTETELPEGWAGRSDYVGPYPPPGATHTYEIYVVALKNPVERMKGGLGAQNPRFEENFKAADTDVDGNTGNILAVGRLAGTFTAK